MTALGILRATIRSTRKNVQESTVVARMGCDGAVTIRASAACSAIWDLWSLEPAKPVGDCQFAPEVRNAPKPLNDLWYRLPGSNGGPPGPQPGASLHKREQTWWINHNDFNIDNDFTSGNSEHTLSGENSENVSPKDHQISKSSHGSCHFGN